MLDNGSDDDHAPYLFCQAVNHSCDLENIGKIDLLNIAGIFITNEDFPIERRFSEHIELSRLV